jgi:hypothetical protein
MVRMYLPLVRSSRTSFISYTKVVYPASYWISLYEMTSLPMAFARLMRSDEFLM